MMIAAAVMFNTLKLKKSITSSQASTVLELKADTQELSHQDSQRWLTINLWNH